MKWSLTPFNFREALTSRRERMVATLDGDFAVFLIGLRVNNPLLVHKWMPIFSAMPRMLRELHEHRELGFLSYNMWFSRTIILLQYWRSLDQLMAYATKRDSEHLPAWKHFNQKVGSDGSVGIWHETYIVRAGEYENIYVNMPPFGLGKAGTLQPARAKN
jgi:hypothetical protein